jgi:hypothetical protein
VSLHTKTDTKRTSRLDIEHMLQREGYMKEVSRHGSTHRELLKAIGENDEPLHTPSTTNPDYEKTWSTPFETFESFDNGKVPCGKIDCPVCYDLADDKTAADYSAKIAADTESMKKEAAMSKKWAAFDSAIRVASTTNNKSSSFCGRSFDCGDSNCSVHGNK